MIGQGSKKYSSIKLYAIVDIETTGGHAAGNGITEIAIYIHDGEKTVEEYHTLINPEKKIPVYITALSGISNAMVASAPTFGEVAATIYELLRDKVFIAHNVNFDFSFVRNGSEKKTDTFFSFFKRSMSRVTSGAFVITPTGT